jgi:hypothetical protein
MRIGILRDVIFACAGVLMVAAAIGLPRQVSAAQPPWQMNTSRCQAQWEGQGVQLMPCYFRKGPPPGSAHIFTKQPPPAPRAKPSR